ncbi:hypothetical protein LAZ67_8000644 [Cordylochernes scorpioides]|uniref:Uncharacterized protein n=1 Tax=Cordylochernes scorpioides TaxID=51811 RepID=A0ABY6KQD9_9ARAC|nr:hypothetical protein LAZ67_8000644 [Cordylochernes scorpioides]
MELNLITLYFVGNIVCGKPPSPLDVGGYSDNTRILCSLPEGVCLCVQVSHKGPIKESFGIPVHKLTWAVADGDFIGAVGRPMMVIVEVDRKRMEIKQFQKFKYISGTVDLKISVRVSRMIHGQGAPEFQRRSTTSSRKITIETIAEIVMISYGRCQSNVHDH